MSRYFRKPPRKVVVYPADVAFFTNKSIRASQRILANIRVAFKKHKTALVTVREFCSYWGILENEWWDRMGDDK